MTIKDRILSFLKEQGISREDFYRTTGLSASNFKGAALNSELGGEKIVKILSMYRDVSADWLLSGEGSMLRSDQVQPTPQPIVQPIAQADSPGEAAAYYKMYKEEKEEKENLLKQIGCLEERLRQLESSQSTSQDKRQSDEIALAFPSDSSGGSIQDSIHTRKPTAILGKSSAGKI